MIRKFATQTCKDKTDAIFGCFYLIFLQKCHGWRNKSTQVLCVRGWSHAEGSAKHRAQQASGGTPDGVSRDARILRKATRLLRTTLILLFLKIRLCPGRKVVCLLLLYKNFRLHLYENILNNCQNFQIKTLLN